MEEILIKFAKYIKENCTDEYGHLRISDKSDGDFCIESYDDIVNNFLQEIKL